jgi:DNA-binding XRE family transcriptional regulator
MRLKMNPERKPPTMTHEEMVAKMLEDPEVRAEYERLNREEFAILDEMLAARREAGLSQAQVAERMGTKAPAVARLESALASGKHSPSLDTLRKYAAALGKRVEVHFVS